MPVWGGIDGVASLQCDRHVAPADAGNSQHDGRMRRSGLLHCVLLLSARVPALQTSGGLATGSVKAAAKGGGLVESFLAIGRQEGLMGYWRGNIPQVRLPAALAGGAFK